MVEKAKSFTIGAGEENKDLCPMVDAAALKRAEDIIGTAEGEGAKLLLDGRGVVVPGCEKGNFLGPTIIDHATPEMTCYTNEIFAPVMVILRVDTLAEAIAVINKNKFGNGCAIFTRSGGHGRKF